MRWGRKKRNLVQDGLFQIGAQAYHILLRGPPLEPPEDERPVVLLIPTPAKRSDRRGSLRSDDYDEWDSRFMLRTDHDDFAAAYNDMWGGQKAWFKPSCIPITIILLLIVLVVLLPLLDAAEKQHRSVEHNQTINKCHQNCMFSLVETIPDGMSYRNGSTTYLSTYDAWRGMIGRANHTIEIATYYWKLRDEDVPHPIGTTTKWPGSEKGEDIFKELLLAGKSRGIKVKIVQSQPTKSLPCLDTEILARKGAAEVRSINMQRLVGGGVLHTKLWIVDREEVYVGSANSDWRALSHLKETGFHIYNCSCLLEDYGKIFDAYWEVALPDSQIPAKWPSELSTPFNEQSPMSIAIKGSETSVYLSSSPPQMCTEGRDTDLNSILSTIHKADHFIHIAVMDYYPLMIYEAKPKFWPVIDNALRAAAIDRKVEVKLLASYWNETRPQERIFLKSLAIISETFKGVSISVKFFVVPSSSAQRKIPYTRVNHNKYMVTDNAVYIGTSNWSGDYFVKSAGVGTIVNGETSLRQELEDVFRRDWNSEFAFPI